MTEIVVTIPGEVNRDKIVTIISEWCRQEGLDFQIRVNGKTSKAQIEAERELLSKPILLGEKFAVKALTSRNRHFGTLDGVTVPGRIMVDIEPGFSFGIGTHATTQMCVEGIEKHLHPGMSVLDIGCGCGILSIVSLLMGADHADGVDISPRAVETSIKNAELNRVSDRFSVHEGNLTEHIDGKYDVIVANILVDPIKELLKSLRKFAHDNTTVILSGIVDFRMAEVLKVAKKDFELIETHMRDNWVCLIFKPK